jgi:hypothetical protein
MTNELHGSKGIMRQQVCGWLAVLLCLSWPLGAAAIWTVLARAPTGVLATADAGRLVSIQGSKVTTTNGYFHVSAYPSALLGISLQVVRTNSLKSGTGLQLCTERNEGDAYWCSDISDGYAGKLTETPFARQAWSHGTMAAILVIALVLTFFGWVPAASAGVLGCTDGDD